MGALGFCSSVDDASLLQG